MLRSSKHHLHFDLQRKERIGQPEVVLAEHKSRSQLEVICNHFLTLGSALLITRVNSCEGAHLASFSPSIVWIEDAACILINDPHAIHRYSLVHSSDEYMVSIVSGGTSDFRVCNEAALALSYLGIQSRLFPDVGVAGIHRFLESAQAIGRSKVILAVAGMDAALVSVCGGYFPQPVIGIPTSTGYGSSFKGQTALNASLASCAQGVTVVNIDNGFGAASAAARMLRILS